MRLDNLLETLKEYVKVWHPSSQGADVFFTGVTADSRQVKPGHIFVAIKGIQQDGADYISAAIKAGANTIVASSEVCQDFKKNFPEIRFLEATDTRVVFAKLASLFYPKKPEVIVAVTGTNGKSSVVEFTRQIWGHLGFRSASLGTIGIKKPNGHEETGLTTLDSLSFHQALDGLAKESVTHLAFEASSHGLDQRRASEVKLQAAGFTQISRDHLDYHGSMSTYLEAKSLLFREMLLPSGVAVLNADIPEFNYLKGACGKHQILTYGKAGEDISLKYIEILPHSQKVSLDVWGVSYHIELPLVGRFQVANVLCALGMVIGCNPEKVNEAIESLSSLKGVTGRLEWVGSHPNGAAIYVDYAHTPDALKTVLEALRHHTTHNLHVVFGCGGNRDKGKRPLMGQVAQELADEIIVTDDNPRYESPELIRKEVLEGCPSAMEIGGRRDAIQFAISRLQRGDILLIAGKGHERGQKIGEKLLPFYDADVVKEILESGSYERNSLV
jgi:UDP-N-acetylmuramoyl-L-alanyl-D-glutamate--2,6-diaminopimelate ligase